MGRGSILALTMAATAACASGQPLTLQGTGGDIQIPADVVRHLDSQWKGAQVSKVVPGCPGQAGVALPPALNADLNGDGAPDLVLRVEQSEQARLYAAFARTNDDEVWRVSPADATLAPGPISVLSRASSFYRDGSGIEEFAGVDTVVQTQCDGQRVAFFWTGSGFEPQRLTAKPQGPVIGPPTDAAGTAPR